VTFFQEISMRGRWSFGLVTGLALAAFAVPTAQAQYPNRMGGGRGRGGERGGFEGRRRMSPPDPVVREGPPVADEFTRIVEGTDSLKQTYMERRLAYMKETQPGRDSLTDFMASMRGMRQDDFARARANMQAMQDLTKSLAERQKAFDEGLKKELLTKDQWKKYDKWRKERRKDAEKMMEERRGGMGGRPPGRFQP